MSEVQITDQQKALLELIAKGEAVRGADPYTSVYPSTSEPTLTQMTCAEVLQYQRQRINSGYASSACGRYQFIRDTLNDCIGYLGIDPLRTRFTPEIQDALIIARLKRVRKLDEWLAGTYATDRFMIKLAQEFASVPVPYRMQAHRGRIANKGDTYYVGDGLNRAHHDPDVFYQELTDILNGGPGTTATIPVNTDGPSGALPASGTTARTQAQRSAAGGGVGNVPGTGRAGQQPIPASNLPNPGDVYLYQATDPLDDRYDFRTGQKIKDLLVHGINAAAASPVTTTNIGESNVAGTNIGVEPPGGSNVQVEVAEPQVEEDPETGEVTETPGGVNEQAIADALSGRAAEVAQAAAQAAAAAANIPCPSPVTSNNQLGVTTPGATSGTVQTSATTQTRVIDTPAGPQTVIVPTSTSTITEAIETVTSGDFYERQLPRFRETIASQSATTTQQATTVPSVPSASQAISLNENIARRRLETQTLTVGRQYAVNGITYTAIEENGSRRLLSDFGYFE